MRGKVKVKTRVKGGDGMFRTKYKVIDSLICGETKFRLLSSSFERQSVGEIKSEIRLPGKRKRNNNNR